MSEIFLKFIDKDGKTILWFRHDRFNLFGQHNPHPEYDNVEAIRACVSDPEEIRQSVSHKRRLCLYRKYVTPGGQRKTMRCVVEYRVGFGVLISPYNAKPSNFEKTIWTKA